MYHSIITLIRNVSYQGCSPAELSFKGYLFITTAMLMFVPMVDGVDCSLANSWRKESSLILWMTLFDLSRYPDLLVLIALLEICQESVINHQDTWGTLRAPDRWLGGQSFPLCHGCTWYISKFNFHYKQLFSEWCKIISVSKLFSQYFFGSLLDPLRAQDLYIIFAGLKIEL